MANPIRPYGGTSKQRLTDLINAKNQTSLVEGVDFEFGEIDDVPGHPGYPRHNTKVRLISKQLGKSDVDVHYTRLGIDILTHLPAEMLGEIIVDDLPLHIRTSINRINRALGLDLTPDEVEDLVFHDARKSYPVQIRQDASVAWLPSEIQVRARHALALALIWTDPYLDGLYPPPPLYAIPPATALTNYTALPAQIVLDLINRHNHQEVPLDAITFGEPQFTGASDRQTVLHVSALPDSGYNGSVDVIYNRIPLSFMGDNEPDLIIETHERSMHALIPFLNQTFGINLTTDDIVDTHIPVQEADVYTQVAIEAKAGSLVYVGDYRLTFTLPLIELSSLIPVWMLDGLHYPSECV